MKKPLTRKNCLTKTSPKDLNHKSCIWGETIKSEANSSEEEPPLSNNMDKENPAEKNKDAITEVIHKSSCEPNAFTKLMFASRSSNPIENLAKEEFTDNEDNDKLPINDNSLIDFVDEINNEFSHKPAVTNRVYVSTRTGAVPILHLFLKVGSALTSPSQSP